MFDQDTFNLKAIEFCELMKELPSERWEFCMNQNGNYLSSQQIYQISDEMINVEIHILLHPSHQVPTIYFKPSYSDGSFLKLKDVMKAFLKNDSYDSEILIQAEHPTLFKPYYTFHPCKVNDVMDNFPESENFILTFFTIYGPLIGLKSQIFNKM